MFYVVSSPHFAVKLIIFSQFWPGAISKNAGKSSGLSNWPEIRPHSQLKKVTFYQTHEVFCLLLIKIHCLLGNFACLF